MTRRRLMLPPCSARGCLNRAHWAYGDKRAYPIRTFCEEHKAEKRDPKIVWHRLFEEVRWKG